MKKSVILFFILSIVSCSSIKSEDLGDLFLFFENGKYGYFNSEKVKVIPAVYNNATDFSDGFAVVGQGKNESDNTNRYSVIDRNNNIIFEFTSEEQDIHPVRDKRILFKKNGKFGFYDLEGNIVLDGYNWAEDFNEGYTVVEGDLVKSSTYIIDVNGDPLLKDDKIIHYWGISNFYEGYANVIERDYYSGEMKYGFIDKKGNVIIPIEYEYLDYRFYNGLCIASDNPLHDRGLEARAFGYINIQNDWVIQPDYYEARPYNGKYAAVRYKRDSPRDLARSYWKLIDLMGNDVVTFDDELIIRGGIMNDRYSYTFEAKLNSGVIGIIDQNGNVLTEANITLHSPFVQEYCPITFKGNNAILTKNGEIILNENFFN